MSWIISWLAPAMAEPTMNSPSPVSQSRRRPWVSESLPHMGRLTVETKV